MFYLKTFHLIAICILCLAAFTTAIKAQEQPVVGGSAGVSLVVPQSTFSSIPGIPSPASLQFEPQDNALLPLFTAFADFALTGRFRVGGRLSYQPVRLNYTALETVPIATAGGGIYDATLAHKLRIDLYTVGAEPYIKYGINDWLMVGVGVPILFQMGSDYLQTQRFTDPLGLSFVDGSVEQITASGALPGGNTVIPAINIGADVLLPITKSRNLQLTASANLTQVLASYHSTESLHSMSFQVSLGFRYTLPASAPPQSLGMIVDTVVVADTVFVLSTTVKSATTELSSCTVENFWKADTTTVVVRKRFTTFLPKPPAVLAASVRLSFMDAAGKQTEDAQLKLWRLKRTRVVPIIPIVVFGAADDKLAPHYVQLNPAEARSWRIGQNTKETHWQYNVLNIVGSRLAKNTTATLGVIAYDDGTQSSTTTATSRAVNVKRYLTTTFGIDQKRVVLDIRRGQASQQPWVFLHDSARALLGPITLSDTLTETRLPQVRIATEVISEAGIKNWKIVASQNGKEVRSFQDSGDVPQGVTWNMNQDVEASSVTSGAITVDFSTTDVDGGTATSTPAKIAFRSQSITDASGLLADRVEVLRVLGADYLNTPDSELFQDNAQFTSVEVYPSASRDQDFLYMQAPVVVKSHTPIPWFKQGLTPADMELFNHVEVYVFEREKE